ncbi:ABC transporter ATP-binding protein [Enterococcus faecalis]|uniref:ABC transporter ATP-binding protein n=1 Tax=Enterococcus faecalis TaxID=1351 RepID=UPI001364D176|nr:ABC transporter ATP-binding protein [Enterococcus faecalis]
MIFINTILDISNLSKTYDKKNLANKNISLTFDRGEITALLGNNGAGKSTLLNQIIGLVKPTSGDIFINNVNIVKYPSYARKMVSYMPQFHAPIKGVSMYQSIETSLRIKGYSKNLAKEKTDLIIKDLDIERWQNLPGEKLSGGLQRLTSFAITLVSPYPVIVLDEPTNDVDPIRRAVMWRYLQKLAKQGIIILVVTHNILEVEKYADRYVLLDKGMVKKDVRISNKFLVSEKHVLNIFGMNRDEVDLVLGNFDIKHYKEEKKTSVFIKNSEVKTAMDIVLKLLASNKIISYELKNINLIDDYWEVVSEDVC